MKKTLFVTGIAALAVLGVLGCDRGRALGSQRDDSTKQSAVPPGTPNDQADNTRRNQPDRGGEQPTAADQGNNPRDLGITQDIRKAVVGDSALSFVAKNCKIIAQNGVVTLRGPVHDEHEKSLIAAKAAAVVGADHVVNELEVETNNTK